MRAFVLLAAVAVYAETAEEIMAKVAANMERAAAGRQQFVYKKWPGRRRGYTPSSRCRA